MTYRLFLDDIRDPTDPDCVVVRTFQDAVAYVREHGFPHTVDFDNDLGEGSTREGIHFAYFLVDYLLDNEMKFPKGFRYHVHSANPVAADRIRQLMDFTTKQIGYEE